MKENKKFPVTITLNFQNEDEKEDFLSGLSDGWGENYCDLDHTNKRKHHYKNIDFNVKYVYNPERDEEIFS